MDAIETLTGTTVVVGGLLEEGDITSPLLSLTPGCGKNVKNAWSIVAIVGWFQREREVPKEGAKQVHARMIFKKMMEETPKK